MTHSLLAVAMAAAGLVASSLVASEGRQQPPPERASEARAITVHASVLDGKGAPVTDLTVEDFSIREDNAAREVLKVGPATEPMHIALLVDDSEAATGAIPYMRDALLAFVEAMHDTAQIAIITVGERPTSVTQYTSSLETLQQGVKRIFPRSGAGAYLTEAIHDAARGLGKREGTWRAIVVLTIEGVEFSNMFAKQVLETLDGSGATLHVIGLGTSTAVLNDEMRNRNTVLVEGSDRTGGRRDTLVSPLAFPDRLKSLAAELSNQYAISYSRPETLIPPDRVAVSTRRPGLTVRAPQRAPEARR
jgi:Ca-activated chloride channel homolog